MHTVLKLEKQRTDWIVHGRQDRERQTDTQTDTRPVHYAYDYRRGQHNYTVFGIHSALMSEDMQVLMSLEFRLRQFPGRSSQSGPSVTVMIKDDQPNLSQKLTVSEPTN